MSTPINQMIDSVVRCVLCGAAKCDCWVKCEKCGWSYEKGKQCHSPMCRGKRKKRKP